MQRFRTALARLPPDADGEAIQNAALNVARRIERYQDHAKQSPEGGPGVSVAFFQMIYQVLIGQERGPRFGSFAALYGIRRDARADRQGAVRPVGRVAIREPAALAGTPCADRPAGPDRHPPPS